MGNQVLEIGNKIEIVQIKPKFLRTSEDKRVYVSQILDFDTDGLIVAAMPIYEEHLIPLEVGTKYDVFFYTKKGIMRSECQIVKRGKEGKIHIMTIALTKDIKKFQRRQYYRCECSIETKLAIINSIEALNLTKNHEIPDDIINRLTSAMMVDISGGGIRIISRMRYEKSAYVYLRFPLMIGAQINDFELIGKVITSIQSENNVNYYDNRIQFKEITRDQREKIIKYVFEQQRKLQKKERG